MELPTPVFERSLQRHNSKGSSHTELTNRAEVSDNHANASSISWYSYPKMKRYRKRRKLTQASV